MSITPNREELAGREMGKRLLAVATAAALLAPSVQPVPAGAAPANGATGDASSNRRVDPNAKKAPATKRSLTPPRRPPMTRRGPMTSPQLRRPRPTGPMTTPWPRVTRPKRRFSARTPLRTRQSRPTMPLSGPTSRRRPRSTRLRRKPRAPSWPRHRLPWMPRSATLADFQAKKDAGAP